MRLALKALFFTLLVPGTVTVLIPWLILGRPGVDAIPRLTPLRIFAVVVGSCGAGALLHCVRGFASYGKGTLAPVQPPELLVTRGLYRFNRNPMYLGVLAVLFAEFLFFERSGLVIYMAAMLACFHLFVVLYEEPRLTRQFGDRYRAYCRAVPRWGLSRRPFAHEKSSIDKRDTTP
jgi:protein-S-isoprenylcysteine O-methyltransferase Ste14